jgi:hypothetical protein
LAKNLNLRDNLGLPGLPVGEGEVIGAGLGEGEGTGAGLGEGGEATGTGEAALKAFCTLILLLVLTLPARLDKTSPVANNFAFKSAADKAGLAAFMRATVPAT